MTIMGIFDRVFHQKDDVGQNLERKAMLLRSRGDFNGALAVLMEQESSYRDQGGDTMLMLVSSFGNDAVTPRAHEDLIIAQEIVQKVTNSDGKFSQNYEYIKRIARSLANQSSILVDLHRHEEALNRINEAQSLAIGIGDNDLITHIQNLKRILGLIRE
jgi:hypothetical protein